MPKQVHAFLGLVGYYRKFIKNFAKIAKPLTLLTHQQVKVDWTQTHHNTFLTLKESIIQAPIVQYPNPTKWYIVYIDTSDDACGAQLYQEHDGMELPIAFLLHTFSEMQRKWSTTEQEVYRVCYTITKCNYYLQGADIIVWNDYKPLNKFLNGKNTDNKVNRWGLELATYNITFKWISGACNKAADCLSHLVELPQDKSVLVNMLSATNTNGPAFNTRCQTHQHLSPNTSTSCPQLDITLDVTKATDPTPKSLMADRLQALLQMQKTEPFCKKISKCLSNGKAPQHVTDLSIHVKGFLYKHVTDCNQKFLALVIPKT